MSLISLAVFFTLLFLTNSIFFQLFLTVLCFSLTLRFSFFVSTVCNAILDMPSVFPQTLWWFVLGGFNSLDTVLVHSRFGQDFASDLAAFLGRKCTEVFFIVIRVMPDAARWLFCRVDIVLMFRLCIVLTNPAWRQWA